MRRKFRLNTPEEEARIQAGIQADPDAAEWTKEDFAHARPASEVVPQLVADAGRRRGAGVKPPKVQVTMRLDRDVVGGLRASGPGRAGRCGRTRRCGGCWSPEGRGRAPEGRGTGRLAARLNIETTSLHLQRASHILTKPGEIGTFFATEFFLY